MDVLLFVLGCFGVLPVITMSIFYGGVMVLMPVLLGVGVLGQWQDQRTVQGATSPAQSPSAAPAGVQRVA